MKSLIHIAMAAAFTLPTWGFAANHAAEADGAPAMVSETLPAGENGAAAAPSHATVPAAPIEPFRELAMAAEAGDAQAQVALGVKYTFAEGVPKDQVKAGQLFCQAARYGNVDGLYQLGWAYANGRGVSRDDAVAARLIGMAADRGHEHAAKLQKLLPAHTDHELPSCMQPAALPVAKALPPLPVMVADDQPDPIVPMAPKEIMQLVQRLAPKYEVDTNLALALISVESAFNTSALSPAKAQGLMQLIPETAERFGVKKPFDPDDNLRGGLSYLRWLLAYFQGNVSLVLAAYNAGEGAVEKHRGIPPYNETRDYVKKITGMYRRLTHPYNASVVAPSPLIEQLKRSM